MIPGRWRGDGQMRLCWDAWQRRVAHKRWDRLFVDALLRRLLRRWRKTAVASRAYERIVGSAFSRHRRRTLGHSLRAWSEAAALKGGRRRRATAALSRMWRKVLSSTSSVLWLRNFSCHHFAFSDGSLFAFGL